MSVFFRPSQNVSVMGQGLRTLVNESYQVKIGNDIVDLSANNNGLSASFAPTSECGMFGYSQDKVAFDGGNKKLVTNCALTPALFGSIVGGEAYVYWKKNGSWKSYSTKINSHSTGRLLTINCDFDQDFNKFEDVRNRSFVNPVRRIWLRPAMMAHDYEILMSVELPNFNVYFEINADIWY